MAVYSECPRCGNKEEGASIWVCKNCGCVHCKECDPENGRCPECDGHVKCIGWVEE